MDNQVRIWICWLLFRHDFSMHTYPIQISSEHITVKQKTNIDCFLCLPTACIHRKALGFVWATTLNWRIFMVNRQVCFLMNVCPTYRHTENDFKPCKWCGSRDATGWHLWFLRVSRMIGWVAMETSGTDIHSTKRVKTFACPLKYLSVYLMVWTNISYRHCYGPQILNHHDFNTLYFSLVPLWVWHLRFWGKCLYK